MSRTTARLPKNWMSFISSSYPGGFIIPNRVECYKKGGEQGFIYTYWNGETIRNVVGNVSKKDIVQLETYCSDVIDKEWKKRWNRLN